MATSLRAWPLRAGALGAWIKLPAVEIVDVLALAGVEFVVIDGEHGSIDARAASALIAAAHARDILAFVRVAGIEARDVLPPLDAGADGIFVPHVDDEAAARAVVDACRLPPIGRRGASPMTRVGEWGRRSADDLRRRANEEVVIVAQIESSEAVDDIEAIAGVPGIDALFVGPFDLSLASGIAASADDFRRMVRRVATAAQGRLALGGVASAPASPAYDFTLVGADMELLGAGAREAIAREVRA